VFGKRIGTERGEESFFKSVLREKARSSSNRAKIENRVVIEGKDHKRES